MRVVEVAEGQLPAEMTISPDSLTNGIVNQEYSFDITVTNVPFALSSIALEWGFGVGAPQRLDIAASNGVATHTVSNTYAQAGTYELDVKAFDGSTELTSATAGIEINGITLSITPSEITDGTTGTQYDFTFSAAGITDPSVTTVTFTYNFGTGESGSSGSATAAVSGGAASLQRSYTYSSSGAFGLNVDVRLGSTILANAVAPVLIDATARQEELSICDVWSAYKSGAYGVTIDQWDISAIPIGAIFDVELDAYDVPDRLIIEYAGSEVLDSNWRGEFSYIQESPSLYPGTYAGTGLVTFTNVFTRVSNGMFTTKVLGPDPGTGWQYRVRCRAP